MDTPSLSTDAADVLDEVQPDGRRITSFGLDHRLVERRFQYQTPTVFADELDGRFAIVPSAAGKTRVSDVMLIDGGRRITHVSRDAGSHTGWSHDHWHGLMAPDQSVVSFRLGEDTIAFWWSKVVIGGVAIRHAADGTWAPDDAIRSGILGAARSVRSPIVHVDDSGTVVVSGWFATNDEGTRFQWGFSYLRAGAIGWVQHRVPELSRTAVEVHTPCDDISFDFARDGGEARILVMLSGRNTASWWAARYVFKHQSGSIRQAQGATRLTESRRVTHVRAMKPVREDQLQYVQGLQDGSLQTVVRDLGARTLPGIVVPLSGVADAPEFVRHWRLGVVAGQHWLYALDAQLRLWVCRELTRDDTRGVTFGAWTELGDRLRYLDVRRESAFEPELFAVTLGNTVERFVRDAGNKTWSRESVENEGEHTVTTIDLSAYATEVACFSAPGVPAIAGRLIEVSATRATDAFINGVSHHLEPTSSAWCETDSSGRVTILVRATSLTAPTLKIGSPDLRTSERLAVRPDVHAHEQLSRTTAASLTTPIPEGPFVGQTVLAATQHHQAEVFASAVRNTGALLLKSTDLDGGDAATSSREWLRECAYGRGLEIIPAREIADYQVRPDFAHMRVPHWTWSFGGAAGAVSYDEISAIDAQDAWADPAGILADLGDVFHRLKNAVDKAVSIVVSVAGQTVQFVVTIAGKIYRCVAETLQQIGQFLEVLFAQMAAAFERTFERVLDWMKERLGWTDILLTKEFFKGMFATIGKGVQDDLRLLPDIIDARYDAFVRTLDSQFAAWTEQLRATPDLRSLVAKMGRAPSSISSSGSYLVPDVIRRAGGATRVHANTVHALAFPDDTGGFFPALAPGVAALSPSQLDIIARFKSALEAVGQAAGALLEGLRQFFRDVGDRPDAIFDRSLLPLLDALKSVVRDITAAIRHVLVLLVEAAAALTDSLTSMLAKPLEIPILSSLYRTLTGSDLTLGDLGCLLIAAPCTLLFKAMGFGGVENGHARAPFANRATVDSALRAVVWPKLAADGSFTVEMPEGVDFDVKTLKVNLAAFGAVISFAGVVTATALDGMAKLNFEKPILEGPAEVLTVLSLVQGGAALACAWPFLFAKPGEPTNLESVGACAWLTSTIVLVEHVLTTIMLANATKSFARPKVAGAIGIVVSGGIDLQVVVMNLVLMGHQIAELARTPRDAALWLNLGANVTTLPRLLSGLLILGVIDTDWLFFAILELVAGGVDVVGLGLRSGLVVFAGTDATAPTLAPVLLSASQGCAL